MAIVPVIERAGHQSEDAVVQAMKTVAEQSLSWPIHCQVFLLSSGDEPQSQTSPGTIPSHTSSRGTITPWDPWDAFPSTLEKLGSSVFGPLQLLWLSFFNNLYMLLFINGQAPPWSTGNAFGFNSLRQVAQDTDFKVFFRNFMANFHNFFVTSAQL